MSDVGQIERNTQNRVVKLFQEYLYYDYLGSWEDRVGNSNMGEELLRYYLKEQGYSGGLIDKAIFELTKVTGSQVDSLYETNKNVYSMLRFGVGGREAKGENTQTVRLINWEEPQHNHFAIAEEVAVQGQHDKRPDIVLYVNGIAVGIIELKRSKASVNKGIRQNLDNQKPEFIKSFFNTMQLVMAGNDTA